MQVRKKTRNKEKNAAVRVPGNHTGSKQQTTPVCKTDGDGLALDGRRLVIFHFLERVHHCFRQLALTLFGLFVRLFVYFVCVCFCDSVLCVCACVCWREMDLVPRP